MTTLCDWDRRSQRAISVLFFILTLTSGYLPSPNIILQRKQPPPNLSLLLAPNLLWHLIMLQVLWVSSVAYSFQHCFVLFLSMLHHNIYKFCTERFYGVFPAATCVLKREVTRSLSVLFSCAVINVFMVWSKCRYLKQLGPSVIFFLWHHWT